MKKKFLIVINLMICWVAIVAQQEVIYGTIETDGYNKITMGAFWDIRPEAKMIYYGQYPDGVEVITLQSNYFVRFAKGENNRLDINYIVFPKGEKVYIKDGNYFAAKCGNRISFIQPVERVEIRDKRIYLDTPVPTTTSSRVIENSDNNWTALEKERVELPKTYIPKKKEIRIWGIVIPAASVITTVAAILYFGRDKTAIVYVDRGRPGAAPPTPPTPPPVTGGPGGANTTP